MKKQEFFAQNVFRDYKKVPLCETHIMQGRVYIAYSTRNFLELE